MSADYEPPPDDSLFVDEEAPGWTPNPEPPYQPKNVVTHPSSPANRDLNYLVPLLERVVAALETLAQNASRPPSAPPGAAVPPPVVQSPGPPAQNGPDTTKMGKKVYAVCRTQGWDVGSIGQQILGREVNPNSQKWSFEDLRVVLDQFTEWNV